MRDPIIVPKDLLTKKQVKAVKALKAACGKFKEQYEAGDSFSTSLDDAANWTIAKGQWNSSGNLYDLCSDLYNAFCILVAHGVSIEEIFNFEDRTIDAVQVNRLKFD